MAVAPSYQKYEYDGYPFEENKKWYINIKTSKGIKKVRWYPKPEDFRINAREAFGFGPENYINLIIGPRADILKWRENFPPYTIFDNTIFGWYAPSTYILNNIPPSIHLVRLNWNEIKEDDIHINQENVRKYIKSIR